MKIKTMLLKAVEILMCTGRRRALEMAIMVAISLECTKLFAITDYRIEGRTLWSSDEEFDPSVDGHNLLGQLPEIILGPG